MTETMELPNELAKILKTGGLAIDKAQNLIEAFRPLIEEAGTLAAAASKVAVTDATQLTEMREASRIRKALVKVRTGAVAAHKEVKADYLAGGRVCDAAKNWLLETIEPVEEAMRAAEEFAERAEALRITQKRIEREPLLIQYGVDPTLYTQLGAMPEGAWVQALNGAKLAYEARIAAEAKIEADRLAAIESDRIERERIKAENERLAEENAKIAAEAKAAAWVAEQARVEAERVAKAEREAAEKAARIEREKIEAAAKVERERAAEELRKANEAREAAEAKIRAEREAAEKKAKADALAAKKAAAAPDREKIAHWCKFLRAIQLPECVTPDGKTIVNRIELSIAELATKIEQAGAAL